MYMYVDMGMDLQGSIKGPNAGEMEPQLCRHVRKHHQHNWGSISPALGPFMLFLRPLDFTKLPKNSGAFPVRFGGAPDAPEAFLPEASKTTQKTRRSAREASLELPSKRSVFPMPSRTPPCGVGATYATPESKL